MKCMVRSLRRLPATSAMEERFCGRPGGVRHGAKGPGFAVSVGSTAIPVQPAGRSARQAVRESSGETYLMGAERGMPEFVQ